MLKHETSLIQQDLARYIRSGNDMDIPGVTQGRLPHYRRLVLNVVYGAIAQAYPITRKVLSEDEWKYLFDSFFTGHDAQTPILWKLPHEFYLYVKNGNYAAQLNKPWLNELLWFEWLEIEVHMMPDYDHGHYFRTNEIPGSALVINRDSRLIQLEYPLHLYAISEAAKKKGSYFVFIFREPQSGSVHFINLSVLHARLLDTMMQSPPVPLIRHLEDIASDFDLGNAQQLELKLQAFTQEMLKKGAFLGYKTN
ncbi:MAG: putative DNA-binding domain-containing protein [Bacteroidales bacterium]|nr:putative DNA-binding domain-containing protein [Bacteroidales bacterium]